MTGDASFVGFPADVFGIADCATPWVTASNANRNVRDRTGMRCVLRTEFTIRQPLRGTVQHPASYSRRILRARSTRRAGPRQQWAPGPAWRVAMPTKTSQVTPGVPSAPHRRVTICDASGASRQRRRSTRPEVSRAVDDAAQSDARLARRLGTSRGCHRRDHTTGHTSVLPIPRARAHRGVGHRG